MYRKKVVYVIKNNQIGKSAKNRHFITALQPVCEESPSKTTDSVIPLILSKRLNELRTKNIFDSWQKTFIFKLHNNALTYNHVIAHFAENIEPYCTFCMLTRNNVLERDTALHVFFSCPTSENLNARLFSFVFGQNKDVRRSEAFGFFNEENADDNFILFVVTKILQKYIWDCKLRKTLPLFDDLKNIVTVELKVLTKISIKFRESLQSCTLRALK